MTDEVDIDIDPSASVSGTAIVTGRPPDRKTRSGDEDSGIRMITSAPPSRGSRSGRKTPRVARSKPALGQRKVRPVRLLPGKRVPGTRYRLVRWLGEGGMGVVYEAEHEDIERRVALKILRPDASSDPVLSARFREEARAASKVGSPHIVEIFDFGELPDGRLMFAMEHLQGHGLDTELDRVPMAESRIIAILRQVCKGLAAAHEVGIIHCDVKPDNVLLINQKDRGDFTKLVDFGIARVMSGAAAEGAAAGTPHYMAPEQIEGKAVDGRADMYAMGCMAYELYTGNPPFSGGSVDDILDAHLHASLPSISTRLPGSVRPELEAVIMRCLSKRPEQRYADMHDVEAALCEAQIAAGLTTEWDDLELPPVAPERLEALRRAMPRPDEPVERRRWLWPAIAAASTLVAIITTVILVSAPEPTPEEKSRVEMLIEAAREAGSKTHWIYGPIEDPTNTSYIHVNNLETVDGATQEDAVDQALALRQEFHESLSGLGDYYWERPLGRSFARDFYLQACLFLPDDTHSCERTGLTPGEFAELRDKASNGRFSTDDLQSAAVLQAMAEPDEGKREEKVAKVREQLVRRGGKPATELVKFADSQRLAMAGGKPKKVERPATTSAGPTIETEPETEPDVEPIDKPRQERDPAKARELVQQAQTQKRKGNRSQATKLFDQALSYDNRNTRALIGLSYLAFDRSKFNEAVKYARKAVDVSPRNASYRIQLGDSYYKLLRYRDAHTQYKRADELGSSEAASRLRKVREKLPK